MGPKRIKEILGQELELSPEVNVKIEETYQLLRQKVMESDTEKSILDGRKKEVISDKEKAVRNEVPKTVMSKFEKTTGIGEITGYRKKRYSKVWVILAAALLLGAGVSVYAAVRYFTEADLLEYMAGENFGIVDFWKKRGFERETESEVLQISDLSGEKMENQYAVYNIQEAFYDGEVIYIVVEVTPKGEYQVVPEDCMKNDLIQCLVPDELPEGVKDLTIMEYAEVNKKELLYTGVLAQVELRSVDCSVDFMMTEGGSGYYCVTVPFTAEEEVSISTVNNDDSSKDKVSVKLKGTARKTGDKEIGRCETRVMILNENDIERNVYIPESQEEISGFGITLQKVEIKESDFGVYTTIYYDLDLNLTPNDITNGLMPDLVADGTKMQNLPGYSGGGVTKTENGFSCMNAYQKMEEPKEFAVAVNNIMTGEEYGLVRLIKE